MPEPRAESKYLRETWTAEAIADGDSPKGWRARVTRRVGGVVVGMIMCDSMDLALFMVEIRRAQRTSTFYAVSGTEVLA